MKPTIEKLDISITELGEGPHWDAENQCLYFVDILKKSINKYVPSTKKHTKAVIGLNQVSFLIPVKGEKNKFLIGLGRQLAVVTWDGESENVSNIETLVEVENESETKDNRFNDGKCDSSGRLWAGTMGANPRQEVVRRGSLYTFQKGKITKNLSNIGISNGLAWSDDNKKMYYIDSITGCIESYDYDINNGKIENKNIIFTASKHNLEGGPDGMTIDRDGNVWAAILRGQKIVKIDPKKSETLLASVHMPTKWITSLVFGGPNLDELYVTSGRFAEDASTEHGATYRITGINAKGHAGISVIL